MMLRLSAIISFGLVILVIAIFAFCPTVSAAKSHEDPESTSEVFSGVLLFQYYSSLLENILEKDEIEARKLLEKAPFTNLPEELKEELVDCKGKSAVLGEVETAKANLESEISTLNQQISEFKQDKEKMDNEIQELKMIL